MACIFTSLTRRDKLNNGIKRKNVLMELYNGHVLQIFAEYNIATFNN